MRLLKGRPVGIALGWIGVLVLTWGAIGHARRVPRAVPAYAPPNMFSAHRATSHIQSMTAQPHATGSAGNALVQAYLENQLRELGLQPVVQTATGVGTRYAVAGRVNNVLARLPGTQPNGKAVLLMAHYDAVPVSPGAGDDGSGVSTILETLRALRAGPALANDVVALFTDGEEAGLLGAAAFVREHPWSRNVGVVLNFEGRGTNGPALMFETGPGNLDVVRVLRSVSGVRATSLSTAVYRRLPNDTDLSELAVLGVPALNFGFIGGVNRYHTAQDDISHLDARSVQHQGDQALALTRAFGNGPLPRPITSDAIFFDFPLVGLVVYPEGWAPWIALVAALMTLGAMYRHRGAGDFGVMTVALVATIAAALVCAIAGSVLGLALERLHAALRSGSPEWSGLYASAIALSAVAITSAAAYVFARRWQPASRAAGLGVLAAWCCVALGLSLLAPAASFLFIWPTIAFGAVALLDIRGVARTLASWLAMALTAFIVVPIVYQLAFVALGVNQVGGGIMGLFTALLVAMFVVQVREVDAVEARWTAIGAALATGGLLVVGAATVRTDDDHPAGVSLVYAVDADSAGAWLTGYAASAPAGAQLRHFLRQIPASTPAAAATAPAWLRRTFASAGIVPVTRVDLPRSEATILSDSTVGPNRRLAIRVRAARGTYSVGMSMERGSVLRAAVDGRIVETDRYRSAPREGAWSLTYVAPPDTGFVLELLLPAATPTTLAFSTRSDGIPPLRLPPRPKGVVQVQGGNTTRTHFRLIL